MDLVPPPAQARVLLTGASGYVGGRLLQRLQASGVRVRCLVRRPAEFKGRSDTPVEIVQADLLDAASLGPALQGVHAAYYLVHAMGAGEEFEALDQQAATHFAAAARAAGVKRIIYLGGLGDEGDALSPHLRSRHEVGRILRSSGATVIEIRASIILGTGSLSFELVRALVERLPLMITPRWVRVQAQPILITDVLDYLSASLEINATASEVVEIGGEDRCTYGDLMQEYARQRGLRRWMISVPFLTPRLSSLWLGLVTPVYARVGRQLIESIRHPTIVQSDAARRLFPWIQPVGLRVALARVLHEETTAITNTRWCDAVSSGGRRAEPHLNTVGPRLLDSRSAWVDAPPHIAFAPIRRIGGQQGWYYATWLWNVRGFLDLLVGGVGMRRGRRDAEHPGIGEPLDFWRVEAYERNSRLVLRAEMRIPGRAWLEFRVEPEGAGSRVHQTAVFDPHGIPGRLYWWAVYPLHVVIFGGMLRRIVRTAAGMRDPAPVA